MSAPSAPRALAPWRSRAMHAAVGAWGVIAALSFAISVPAAVRASATVCAAGSSCPAGRLDTDAIARLAELGISPQLWGLLETGLDVAFALTCFLTGAMLVRGRSDVGAANAAMLFALGISFPQTLDAAATVHPAFAPVVTIVTSLSLAALLAWVLTLPDGRLRGRASVGVLATSVGYVIAVPIVGLLGMPWPISGAAGLLVLSAVVVDVAARFVSRRRRGSTTGGAGVLVAAAVAVGALGVAGVLQGSVVEPGTIGDVALQLVLVCAFLGIPISIGMSVLRRGLGDARGSLVRTLAGGATATALFVIFALVYALGVAAGGEVAVVAVCAAAALAIVALPLFSALRAAVVRLTRSPRSEAYAVESVSERMPHPMAADDLAGIVAEVLALDRAWVDTADAPGEGAADPGVHAFPISHGGVSLGRLMVRPKPLQDLTGRREQSALRSVAAYLGAAMAAAAREEELHRAHAELIVAREEERRLLRDELHDDLGPLLSSVVLRLRAAEKTISDAAARGLVEGSRRDVGEAVGAMRRIVYGLRPPGLAERGLAESLRDYARSLPGLEVEVEDHTGSAPIAADTQLAAYRIGIEAIANAARHSGGTTCALELRVHGDALLVSVHDDGSGAVDAPGVGVQSMVRRAEQVGGELTVSRTGGGGVAVVAALPLSRVEEPA